MFDLSQLFTGDAFVKALEKSTGQKATDAAFKKIKKMWTELNWLSMVQAYVRKMEEHLEAASGLCQSAGIDYFISPTDRPLDLALYDFLSTRARRAAGPARTGINPNVRSAS